MAGLGAQAVFQRRQAEAPWHQQARRHLPADVAHPRGQGRRQGRRPQGRQPEPMGQRLGEAAQQEHCGGGGRQQERQGRVGLVGQGGGVRDAKPGGNGQRGLMMAIKVKG